MRVDEARSRFLLFAATLAVSRDEATAPLRLAGLDPDRRYRVRLCNPELLEAAATRRFPSPLLAEAGLVLSGAALMRAGLVLPLAFPDTVWILEGRALVAEGGRCMTAGTPVLAAVDWGTSRFRLWLLDGEGRALAQSQGPEGLDAGRNLGFETVLRGPLGPPVGAGGAAGRDLRHGRLARGLGRGALC